MHSAILEVELSAISANWRLLNSRLLDASAVARASPEHSSWREQEASAGGKQKKTCGAVVKANAYGMGVIPVSKKLAEAGCTDFFVATLEEAIELRTTDNGQRTTNIYVFNGIAPGEEKEFLAHNLIPVLNTPGQIELWSNGGNGKPSALHLDTGMCRLGLTLTELKKLTPHSTLYTPHSLLLSHLACAGDPKHPENREQLERFREMTALLPGIPRSLCNSSGIFLGSDFHFDLARPGCALYGINPTPHTANPMQGVATLTAPILQIRHLDRDETVGYDATYTAKKGARIATLGIGYADGLFRSLSNRMHVFIGKYQCPLVGRISMDMVMADISAIPESQLSTDLRAELIGPHQPVDTVADLADTIGYEVFTRLGRRIKRIYRGGQEASI